MDRMILYDRIAGCMMGGALGDALGYEVEFLPWEMIKRQYGQVRALETHGGKARFSDDTQKIGKSTRLNSSHPTTSRMPSSA